MSITHKDISLLSQKSTIAGTEKIPVSGTKFVTTNQIASLASGGGNAVTDVTVGGVSVVSNGVAAVPTIPTVPTISTNITSDASSDDKTASPKAVKTYVDGIVGNIETLLAAI